MEYKLRTFLSLLLVLENKFSYGIFLLIIWFSSQGHIAFVFPKGWFSDCSFLQYLSLFTRNPGGQELSHANPLALLGKQHIRKTHFIVIHHFIPSILGFLRICIRDGCWNLSNSFPAPIDIIMWGCFFL